MLDDIRWEFGSRRYLSLEQFVTEVSRVNKSAWPHDEIVMNNPKVAFEYSALISSLDELLPCENLAHADAVLRPTRRRRALFGGHPGGDHGDEPNIVFGRRTPVDRPQPPGE